MTGPPGPAQVKLSFEGHPAAEEVRADLSCVVRAGHDLWLASDEGTALERLSPIDGYGYGGAIAFDVADLLELPGKKDDEIDIEGLDFSEGCLWLVGSHAVRRKNPDPHAELPKQLEQLANVKRKGNRHLLARLPMHEVEEGHWEPIRGTKKKRGRSSGGAARLAGDAEHDELTQALLEDPHLAPSISIPGKDNGLDVEGLAVSGKRVFLGLRGPVLRGWAVILSIAPVVDPADPSRLRLGAAAGGRRRYAKHFLDLHGLGVRELVTDRDDLLVLAGPTMDLDGRAAVFRWPGGARIEGDSMVGRADLEHVLEVPYGNEDHDHPEGIALMPRLEGGNGLLVVYDAPHPDRLHDEHAVDADLFPLP